MIYVDLLELMLHGKSGIISWDQTRKDIERVLGSPNDVGGTSKKYKAPTILMYSFKEFDCQVFLDALGKVTIGFLVVMKKDYWECDHLLLANSKLSDFEYLSENTISTLENRIKLVGKSSGEHINYSRENESAVIDLTYQNKNMKKVMVIKKVS